MTHFMIGIDPGYRRTALCMLMHGGEKPVLVALQSREREKCEEGLHYTVQALSIARWAVGAVASLEYHAGCKFQSRIAVETTTYMAGRNVSSGMDSVYLSAAIITGLLWEWHSEYEKRVCAVCPQTWRAHVLGKSNIKTPSDRHLREMIDFGDYKKRTNDDLRDAVAIALWAGMH